MKRHFSMTFSAILSIGIAILLSLVMALVTMNVDRITESVEGQLELQVSLSPGIDEAKREEIGQKIEETEGVASARYSDKDEELNELISENGEIFSQYKNANPLYDVYVVEPDPIDTIQEVADQIDGIDGVIEVSYGGSAILSMIQAFASIRTIGLAVTAGLMFLGVFLIRNTITMTVAAREDEISIMRTVGAYNFYILTPFLLEGLSIGFWGALIPDLICTAAYSAIYAGMDGAVVSSLFSMVPPYPMLLWLSLAALAAGMALGLFGSWLAVHKYIRRAR